MRKIPIRKCLATNNLFPKKELLRIVKTPDNEIKVDLTGRLNGRGAYISKSIEALEILRKKKLLNKHLLFEEEINDSVYQEILKIIEG